MKMCVPSLILSLLTSLFREEHFRWALSLLSRCEFTLKVATSMKPWWWKKEWVGEREWRRDGECEREKGIDKKRMKALDPFKLKKTFPSFWLNTCPSLLPNTYPWCNLNSILKQHTSKRRVELSPQDSLQALSCPAHNDECHSHIFSRDGYTYSTKCVPSVTVIVSWCASLYFIFTKWIRMQISTCTVLLYFTPSEVLPHDKDFWYFFLSHTLEAKWSTLFSTINVVWKEAVILCFQYNNGEGNKLSHW